ncbi:MAG: TolC family protein [Spirochaetia bacterium]|nr:TolC family protein [Spirochaetia bacterium]
MRFLFLRRLPGPLIFDSAKIALFCQISLFLSSFNFTFAYDARYFIEKAFENSLSLKSDSHMKDKAEFSYKSESYFLNSLQLETGYNNAPLSSWPSLSSHAMSNISVGISQNIAMPWESELRSSASFENYLSETEKYNHQKNILAFNVVNLYEETLFIQTKKKILKENASALGKILKTARSLTAVNKMASSQLFKIEADIAFLETQILQLDAELEKKRFNLRALCNYDFDWNKIEASSLEWMNKSEKTVLSEDFSAENTSFVKFYQKLYESQKIKESLSYASLLPSVKIGIKYTIRQEIPEKDTGEDFISIQASMPLPLHYAYKDRHKISESGAIAKSYYEKWQDAKQNLLLGWQGERKKAVKLKEAYEKNEIIVLPKYLASYKAQVAALSAGNLTLIDVLDSYRKYLDASLEQAKLYLVLRKSIALLDFYREAYVKKETNKEK